MNILWFSLLIVAFGFAAATGRVQDFTSGLFESAQFGFDVTFKLVGVMVFWLGLMKIAEKSGLVNLLAKAVSPLLSLIFRGVPKGHPALSAVALNMAANALGLDNAATPLGIKAMEELDKLNPKQGVLSDAQAMLVGMNTASMALMPVTIINLRLASKSKDAYEVVGPILLATATAFAVAVISSKLFARTRYFKRQYESAPDKAPDPATPEKGAA